MLAGAIFHRCYATSTAVLEKFESSGAVILHSTIFILQLFLIGTSLLICYITITCYFEIRVFKLNLT